MKIEKSFKQEQPHGHLGHHWVLHGVRQFPTKRGPPKDANNMKVKVVDKRIDF